MRPLYDHHFSTIPVVDASGDFGLLFGANQRRVSFTITSGDTKVGSVLYVATAVKDFRVWLRMSTPGTFVATYRDFGPLIGEPVYVAGNGFTAGATVSGVEVVSVPQAPIIMPVARK